MKSHGVGLDGTPWWWKDPGAKMDFALGFSRTLGDDTLASATWTVPAGLTKESESINSAGSVSVDGYTHPASTLATLWLSGGAAGTTYRCTCRLTTAAGRIDDQSIDIVVRER